EGDLKLSEKAVFKTINETITYYVVLQNDKVAITNGKSIALDINVRNVKVFDLNNGWRCQASPTMAIDIIMTNTGLSVTVSDGKSSTVNAEWNELIHFSESFTSLVGRLAMHDLGEIEIECLLGEKHNDEPLITIGGTELRLLGETEFSAPENNILSCNEAFEFLVDNHCSEDDFFNFYKNTTANMKHSEGKCSLLNVSDLVFGNESLSCLPRDLSGLLRIEALNR
ncbi:hypothetical protein LMH73_028800, partial [Vibrio splendidus]